MFYHSMIVLGACVARRLKLGLEWTCMESAVASPWIRSPDAHTYAPRTHLYARNHSTYRERDLESANGADVVAVALVLCQSLEFTIVSEVGSLGSSHRASGF